VAISLEELRKYKQRGNGATVESLRKYKERFLPKEEPRLAPEVEKKILEFKLPSETPPDISRILATEVPRKEKPSVKDVLTFTGREALRGVGKEIKRKASLTEEERTRELKEFAETPTGAFGYGLTGGVSKFILPGPKGKELFEAAQEARPTAFGIGKAAGTLGKYATLYTAIGPTIEKIPALAKLGKGVVGTLTTEIAKDISIGIPVGTLDALAEGKKGKELIGEAAKNLAMDAVANAAFYGAGIGVKAISKAYKARKAVKLPEVVSDVIKKAEVMPEVPVKKVIPEVKPVKPIKPEFKPIKKVPEVKPEIKPLEVKTIKAIPEVKPEVKPVKPEIPPGAPKTPSEQKIVNQYKTTLPKDELGLEKIIKTLERQAETITDEKKRIKVNLQLFAAKEELVRIRERGFAKGIRKDKGVHPSIKESFEVERLEYEQISNPVTLKKAEKIFDRGYEKALDDWNANIETFRPEDIPLARMLANKAAIDGNMERARSIITQTAEKLTRAGQYSQAAKILRQSDPVTSLTYLEKELDKLNKQGRKTYKKKWKDFNIKDDEFKKLMDGDQATRDKTMQDIGDRISQNMPAGKLEKFDAFRRIAMLLNPKTHIRNTIGNVIMAGMRKTADITGAAIEKVTGVPAGQRTKSFLWSRNKDIAKAVDSNWNTVKGDLLKRSRWSIENLKFIGGEKRIFKSNTLNFFDKVSKSTLNAEDAPFVKSAYKDSLGQFMQANKLSKVTEAATDYAKRRAYEATFKQANQLSSLITKAKKAKGVGRIVEAAIPFAQTPTNILARSLEYSPIGLVKSLYSKVSGKSAANVIEDLAKGMTGTAIAGLGYMLASQGWMRVERSKSKNVEGIMRQLGEQPMSVTTPLGSYTFDWAQPLAIPLAMGAAVFEVNDENQDLDMIEAIKEALAAGGDTIFNMSMMQNIQELFGGGFGSPTEAIMDLPISYIEQAFPTVFGQIARTFDPIRRTTYDPKTLKSIGRKFLAKTPITSRILEPSLDVWGNEQKQGGAIQQFFSPGYVKEISTDPATKEMVKLYKATDETSFLPKVAPRKITSEGEEIKLTPKEITTFQKSMGQKNHKQISALIKTNSYKMLSNESKAKRIKKIVDNNYESSKKSILKNRD